MSAVVDSWEELCPKKKGRKPKKEEKPVVHQASAQRVRKKKPEMVAPAVHPPPPPQPVVNTSQVPMVSSYAQEAPFEPPYAPFPANFYHGVQYQVFQAPQEEMKETKKEVKKEGNNEPIPQKTVGGHFHEDWEELCDSDFGGQSTEDETQQSFFESLYAALDADANEIADGLFLGAAKAASDKAAMKKRKISHVLIAHPNFPEKHPNHFRYGRAPLVDIPNFNLLELIPDALAFFREDGEPLAFVPTVHAHFARPAAAAFSSSAQFKVCINGGAGGIGQPLTMLMAMNETVKEVSVQDVTMAAVPPSGVAADLGHLEFPSKAPNRQLEACLTGCNLVLIPAGMPRKPGMTRDDLFNVNAGIAKGVVEACAKFCPDAVVGLIVNPVNSIVPAMAELYKKKGLDPLKIVGVTTLDIVRANKFVAEITGKSPKDIEDPISATISADKIPALDKRTQDGGTEVVEAKAGKGSATLSMAYSGARFGNKVLAGLAGTPTDECAYVASSVTELPYFSSKVTFGKTGVEKIHDIGTLNSYEQGRLKEAMDQLKTEIDKGLDYAKSNC
eukprot:g16189.t1